MREHTLTADHPELGLKTTNRLDFVLQTPFLDILEKTYPKIDPFSTNSFRKSQPPIRSLAKATRLKRCVYGSSHYELSIKKVDVSTKSADLSKRRAC